MMEQFGSLHITNLVYKFNDYFYRNLFHSHYFHWLHMYLRTMSVSLFMC